MTIYYGLTALYRPKGLDGYRIIAVIMIIIAISDFYMSFANELNAHVISYLRLFLPHKYPYMSTIFLIFDL